MDENNISINYSIGTRSCAILCILISTFELIVEDSEGVTNPIKLIEKVTKNKRTTISKIMDEIVLILDYFLFLKTDHNIDDYADKIKNFVKKELTIKKRYLKLIQ